MSTSSAPTSRPVIGSVVYSFPVLDSTNVWAAKLLTQTPPPNGTVVRTTNQTRGLGQQGNAWHSAPGANLSLSVVLYPELQALAQFALNMGIALAVRDTIAFHSPALPVTVKWPNDIYIGGCKVAGILIQNTLQGPVITSTIAGIGLNVNETDFPPALPNPTSLATACGRPFRVTEVYEVLIDHLTDRLSDIGTDRQRNDYHAVLYRRAIKADFILSATGERKTGYIRDVDNTGHLRIDWEDGTKGAFGFKEIEFVT